MMNIIDFIIAILAFSFVLFVIIKNVIYYKKNRQSSNCTGHCMYCDKNCYKK